MTYKNLYFIGGGGHFKVAYEIAKLNPEYVIQGYFDDSEFNPKGSYPYNKIKYLGTIKKDLIKYNRYNSFLGSADDYFFISIGDNKIRKQIKNNFKIITKWATLIHPKAIINNDPKHIGQGTLICAGAVIEPGTYINDFCIINTNASVNHDCHIDTFVHICPGSTLCGNVKIDSGTMIGAGSTIIPKINVGEWCIIGSGSNIIKNIRRNTLAFGNPCKEIKDIEKETPL